MQGPPSDAQTGQTCSLHRIAQSLARHTGACFAARMPLLDRPSTIELARKDAEELIATFSDRAYEIARTHAREQMLGKEFDRPRAHWSRVKNASLQSAPTASPC